MGIWAKHLFDKETFAHTAIIITGQHHHTFEERVLTHVDEITSKKDLVYHAYLCRKHREHYPIVFNVYGAPALLDLLSHLKDGGCENVILVGYGNGHLKNLEIGKIIIPEKSYHYDGSYAAIESRRKHSSPDEELTQLLQELLRSHSITFVTGSNISITAQTHQPPIHTYYELHAATTDMELAACLSKAKDLGMRATGILIIAENNTSSLSEATKQKLYEDNKHRVLKTLIIELENLALRPLEKGRNTLEKYRR